ncbi:hypothetical protein GCM10023169_22400 [Georgenia halophila]|uniref:Uncharacterized protein n=1 Tax=Georgenia halophila TaxID=620889 RepID=A0ABP8LA66_9MICO
MPLVRIELVADSREHGRRVLDRYRKGEREHRLEDEVLAELALRGFTPRRRPRLTGISSANPPLLLFDTDVDVGTVP